MGKKIDRFVLSLATALGLYYLLQQRIRNPALAIPIAICMLALFRKLIRKLQGAICRSAYFQRRHIRRQAAGAIMHFACADPEFTRARLHAMLDKLYHEGEAALEIIQYPPSATLDQQRLFDAWKSHRGEKKLVICATCKCDPAARALAGGMKAPKIALMDADAIRSMIAECPEELRAEPPAPRRQILLRLKKAAALLLQRKNAPRCALLAACMLGIYFLNGRISYLIASMLLFFCAIASLRRASKPAKLF